MVEIPALDPNNRALKFLKLPTTPTSRSREEDVKGEVVRHHTSPSPQSGIRQPTTLVHPGIPSIPSKTRGHYRTHSSLDGEPAPLTGATVVRTPSEARRGIMKSRLDTGSLGMGISMRHATSADSVVKRLSGAGRRQSQSRNGSPLGSVVRSADLPMMDECDRRVSPPAPPPVPKRGLAKVPSLPTIAQTARIDNESYGDLSRAHRKSLIIGSTQSSRLSIKPLPPPKPASRVTHSFSARVIDITQRPAPDAQDEVLVKLAFGFSTAASTADTSCVNLPLDVLKRAPGQLLSHVEDYLAGLSSGGGVEVVVAGSCDSKTSTDSSRPSLTDGESAEESDIDSEYGAASLLRDEYLKSLWIASPTTPDLAPALPPLPRSSSIYTTQPKGRARVRNQYTQNVPWPAPSSPLYAQHTSVPLSLRRRATFITLPKPETRGTITTVTVLLMRDAMAWNDIACRVAQGAWAWDGMEEDVEIRRRKQAANKELEWAGMEYMVVALKSMDSPRSYDVPSSTSDRLPEAPVREHSAQNDMMPPPNYYLGVSTRTGRRISNSPPTSLATPPLSTASSTLSSDSALATGGIAPRTPVHTAFDVIDSLSPQIKGTTPPLRPRRSEERRIPQGIPQTDCVPVPPMPTDAKRFGTVNRSPGVAMRSRGGGYI